ncbi:MAG: hypothetical protein ACLQRM_09660, partial [Acidimicrobiales bacterium]
MPTSPRAHQTAAPGLEARAARPGAFCGEDTTQPHAERLVPAPGTHAARGRRSPSRTGRAWLTP